MVVEQVKQKAQNAIWKGVENLAKEYGWDWLVGWTPGIGFLWPANIILVFRKMWGNLMGPEGLLLLIVAIFCYLITGTIGVLEFWVDLGFFTTLVTWTINSSFAFYFYWRGRNGLTKSAGAKENENPSDTLKMQTKANPKPAAPKSQKKAA